MKCISTLVAVAVLFALAAAAQAEALKFDASQYSQQPTGCDILTAHPDDPLRVAPGVRQSQVDAPAAIAACEVAVARDPANPRLRYQLGRAYGYAGQGEKAGVHREAAVAANYPQALFVIGFLHLTGENKAPKDLCRAAELIHRSAQYGRLAGQIGYPMWVMEGRFKGCATRQDPAEMLEFLEAADKQTSDFYQESLIAVLKRDLKAFKPSRG